MFPNPYALLKERKSWDCGEDAKPTRETCGLVISSSLSLISVHVTCLQREAKWETAAFKLIIREFVELAEFAVDKLNRVIELHLLENILRGGRRALNFPERFSLPVNNTANLFCAIAIARKKVNQYLIEWGLSRWRDWVIGKEKFLLPLLSWRFATKLNFLASFSTLHNKLFVGKELELCGIQIERY